MFHLGDKESIPDLKELSKEQSHFKIDTPSFSAYNFIYICGCNEMQSWTILLIPHSVPLYTTEPPVYFPLGRGFRNFKGKWKQLDTEDREERQVETAGLQLWLGNDLWRLLVADSCAILFLIYFISLFLTIETQCYYLLGLWPLFCWYEEE